jgi:hypothetical protein
VVQNGSSRLQKAIDFLDTRLAWTIYAAVSGTGLIAELHAQGMNAMHANGDMRY